MGRKKFSFGNVPEIETGTYPVSGSLVIPSNIELVGNGVTISGIKVRVNPLTEAKL